MSKRKTKTQSQNFTPIRTSPGESNIGECGNHMPEIAEMIAMEVKKQLHKAIEEMRSEIISQAKSEMTRIMKEMLKKSEEEIYKKIEEQRQESEAFNEKYKKDLEHMNQILRDIQENKAATESYQNRLNEAEDRISDLEDSMAASDRERTDLVKTARIQEKSIQQLQDEAKRNNVRIIGVNETAGSNTNDIKRLLAEIIEENFPRMETEPDIQVNEAFRTPNNHNQSKTTPRHIIVKFPELQQKNKILKAAREKKQITYKGKPIRITADFSAQTIQSRRAWSEILQVLRENSFQPRLMYPAKLSLKFNGEIKYFHDKEQLKNFMSTKPALQKILKDILDRERSDHNFKNNRRNETSRRANR